MNKLSKMEPLTNELQEIKTDLTNITYYKAILTNGLKVYLLKKPNFVRTHGVFISDYGSIDQEFIPINQTEFIKTPAGVAHFLEHKLFELENGNDAISVFSEIGADANAQTGHYSTSYYFDTVHNVEKAVEILLDFVQKPSFNAETVEKERGIIEEELKMCGDDPRMELYAGLFRAMYKENEVNQDIGGTVKSIKTITKELLDLCHQTFYHPSNMALIVVGNIEPEKIFTVIKDNQSKKEFIENPPKIKRKFHLEDQIVYKRQTSKKMDIIIPKVIVGLKLPILELSDLEKTKNELLLMMLIQIYYESSGDFFYELRQADFVNRNFDFDVAISENYGYITIKTDTFKTKEFVQLIKKQFLKISSLDVSEEVFARQKKALYTLSIMRLNSLSFLASLLQDEAFSDLPAFDIYKIINSFTREDLLSVRKYFQKEAITSFVIYPLKKEND